MAQYFLTVHYVDGQGATEQTLTEQAGAAPDQTDMQAVFEAVDAFNTKLQANGQWVFAGGLQTPDTSTVVDASKGGDPVITDGPFSEAKEQIGGFWIIDVPDLDAALEVAAEGSAACMGPVEVRPFQDEPEA
jgi:hypothetical protein